MASRMCNVNRLATSKTVREKLSDHDYAFHCWFIHVHLDEQIGCLEYHCLWLGVDVIPNVA